jgi:hypothetical protein
MGNGGLIGGNSGIQPNKNDPGTRFDRDWIVDGLADRFYRGFALGIHPGIAL